MKKEKQCPHANTVQAGTETKVEVFCTDCNEVIRTGVPIPNYIKGGIVNNEKCTYDPLKDAKLFFVPNDFTEVVFMGGRSTGKTMAIKEFLKANSNCKIINGK